MPCDVSMNVNVNKINKTRKNNEHKKLDQKQDKNQCEEKQQNQT